MSSDNAPKPDHIPDVTKMVDEQRRREMFERVATIYILNSKEYNGDAIKKICERAIRDADKFAKGEE